MNPKLLSIAHSGVVQQIKFQIKGRKTYNKKIKTQNPNTLHPKYEHHKLEKTEEGLTHSPSAHRFR